MKNKLFSFNVVKVECFDFPAIAIFFRFLKKGILIYLSTKRVWLDRELADGLVKYYSKR